MEQYMKKMKMLFYRQPGVSLLQEDEAISVRINRSDIGEEAGSWLSATKKRVEKKIPELEKTDYGCREIVSVTFKETEEVRKQRLTHEIFYFTLEEVACEEDKYESLYFPLKKEGFKEYMEFHSKPGHSFVCILYNFYEIDNEPKLLIEGKWMKPTSEPYDVCEKRIKQLLPILEEKIKLEITNTPNWQTLPDKDPIREKILDKYAIHYEPYSEESEKKLEKILNQ